MSSSNPFNLPRAHIRAQSDKIIQSQQLNSARTVASCVDTTNKLMKVDVAAASGSHGLATEAKQDDQITKLTEIDTAIDSIDEKITVGDDDTLATAQQVCIYGRKDASPAGLRATKVSDDGTLHTYDGGLNTKITAGSDDSITGSLQQNLVYGRFDNDGTLKAIKCSSDGSVITAPAGGTIITTDGTTSEQRVMILGNHNNNLRTIACGEGGQLQTEIDHSWDNTNTLINIVTAPAGATLTSTTFDLGQGVSHEIGNVEFFLTNSASLDVEVVPEVSHNGTVWYGIVNAPSVNTTKQYTAFGQEEIGITIGHRYMRFQVTNNDGLASTDITLIAAYYK